MLSFSLFFVCLVGISSAGEDAETLYSSDAKVDFYPLARHFVTQKTQTYCGVASAVTVLNAIGVQKVTDPVYYPYPYVTQDNFFTNNVLQIIQPKKVLAKGIILDQLAESMQTFGVNVKVYHVDENLSYENFMGLVAGNLHDGGDYIIVNYDRRVLDQDGAGHISPLGAYNTVYRHHLIGHKFGLKVGLLNFPPAAPPSAIAKSRFAVKDKPFGSLRDP